MSCPNVNAYRAFLLSVGIPPSDAPGVFPSAAGTVSAGTAWSLTDISADWTPNQWANCVIFDVTQCWSGSVISNTATEIDFVITPAGNPAGLTAAPGDSYLVVPAIVPASLDIALETVNATLLVAPQLYTFAVYNLAADRLLNYATDLPGQTFFRDIRTKYKLLDPTVGVIQAASDQGTSGAYLNLEAMKNFTLGDLQSLKTPFGRAYLDIAMSYGPNLYGVS